MGSLLIGLRDLQWRRRRVVVALAGTSLVLALTLVLSGVSASFGNEATRSVDALHAMAWVVPQGEAGPFMSSATLPASTADLVAAVPKAGRAEPVAILRGTVHQAKRSEDVNVIGVRPGSFAAPRIIDGRAPRRTGEATADRRLGMGVGSRVTVGGAAFTIVGRTSGLTYRAGVPTVYVPLADAQAVAFAGQPLATAVVTTGVPVTAPPGMAVLDGEAVRADLLAPLAKPRQTISLVLGLLWMVAGMIIGSVVYLSALDRVRDFAVFKATGAADRVLYGNLAVQALVLAGGAALVGAVLSRLLAPMMPMQAEIGASSYLVLIVLAAVVAVVASSAGIRRAVTVDPALAFGGA